VAHRGESFSSPETDYLPEGVAIELRLAVFLPRGVVYEVPCEADELMPGEIVARYAGCVDDLRSKRTVRKYLHKLEQYNLVESAGQGPSRVYRTADG